MISFYAELQVDGHTYTVRHCTYEFTQATGERGRPVAKVRHGLVRLTLDVPQDEVLLSWAAAAFKPLAGQMVFRDGKDGPALETLAWEAGHCVGYQEEFVSGDTNAGAYVCHLTIAAPQLTMKPGGPAAYQSPAAGEHGSRALVGGGAMLVETEVITASIPELVAEPTIMELLGTAASSLGEALAAAASAAALPVALTLALILGSSTPAGGPGLPSKFPIPSPDALRLLYLETQREVRALTPQEKAELIALLAKVRGVHVSGPEDVAYLHSHDIAFNKLWDQHAPPALKHLDLQSTISHVEARDYSVPRGNGIGGAHNAVEWAKHHADYVEISRTHHPTIPGVEQVKYQIPAIKRDGKPTGVLKSKIFEKTLYDPKVWPPSRLERALKQSLGDAYRTNANTLPREWDGLTAEGYPVHGYYDAVADKVTSFFFK